MVSITRAITNDVTERNRRTGAAAIVQRAIEFPWISVETMSLTERTEREREEGKRKARTRARDSHYELVARARTYATVRAMQMQEFIQLFVQGVQQQALAYVRSCAYRTCQTRATYRTCL